MTTTVKFVELSPATTALLGQRLAGKTGLENYVTIKQTVVTFRMQAGAVVQLLDQLIKDEIPGTGPQGQPVKRLREVKRRLRDALAGMDADHSKVHITDANPLREQVIDLVTQICWRIENLDDASDEVSDLVDLSGRVPGEEMATSDRDRLQTWLREVL